MIARGTVLVSGARDSTAALRLVIEQLGGRVVQVGLGESVAAAIEHEHPDVVILPMAGVSPVLERVLGRERHSCALVGVLGVLSDDAPAQHALFDTLVVVPPDQDARERLRLTLLLGRARREAHDIGREVGRLRETTSAAVQRLTGLLLAMLDRRHPGSTGRAAQFAEVSLQIAERFGVPDDMLPALDIAARLREVGRLVLPSEGCGGPGDTAWEWSVTQATAQLLEPFPELAQPVELLTGMHENWDGTGHPGHLMSGQIPLRSRVLRATSDYLRMRSAHDAPPAREVLEQMAELTGTRYDPLVIVQLRTTIEAAGAPPANATRVYLPIPELQVGMKLAEDLFDDGGMKLLSRGTVLGATVLEVILRRHAQEPMYRGVAVQRHAGS